MTDESAKRADFNDRIVPRLDVLVQISLSLTKNGRDANRLMRGAIAEAYGSWDESTPAESCDLWIYDIMTKRYQNGFQSHTILPVPTFDGKGDDTLAKNGRLLAVPPIDGPPNSSVADKSHKRVNFLNAITSLPTVLKYPMILSYIEGSSFTKIATMAGVRPHKIKSLLFRGCGIVRNELFAVLLDNRIPGPVIFPAK